VIVNGGRKEIKIQKKDKKYRFLINYLIVLSIFIIAIAVLFIIQSTYPIRSISPVNGKNGGMHYELDAPFPAINDTASFGDPERAYDDLVKGVNVLEMSTGGTNVKITNVSAGYYETCYLPVYIFKGYFNDTDNNGQYVAYVASPVYVFKSYFDEEGNRVQCPYVKSA
jgi:hypothetical protein